jgi:ElaB/YqjD/DUF883 family membrane-anchored ribosome-binding protein
MPNTETQTDQELRIPPGPERSLQRIEDGGAVTQVSANGSPSSPDEMQQEIERTRQRMSHTLDLIEDRLVRQKEDLWAKATMQGFRRRISSEPWRSLAIAFAVGYIVAAIRD